MATYAGKRCKGCGVRISGKRGQVWCNQACHIRTLRSEKMRTSMINMGSCPGCEEFNVLQHDHDEMTAQRDELLAEIKKLTDRLVYKEMVIDELRKLAEVTRHD